MRPLRGLQETRVAYLCDRHYKDTSRSVSHQEGSYQDREASKRTATHGAELAQFSHLPLVFDPGFLANLLNPMRKERICQHSELRRILGPAVTRAQHPAFPSNSNGRWGFPVYGVAQSRTRLKRLSTEWVGLRLHVKLNSGRELGKKWELRRGAEVGGQKIKQTEESFHMDG